MRTYGVGMRGGFLVIEGWVVSPIIPGESAQNSKVGELWVHRQFRDSRESSY